MVTILKKNNFVIDDLSLQNNITPETPPVTDIKFKNYVPNDIGILNLGYDNKDIFFENIPSNISFSDLME